MSGTATNLTCTVPHPVQWFFKPVNVKIEQLIFNGLKLSPYGRYDNYYVTSVNDSEEILSMLTIWNVSEDDAGIYTCKNINIIQSLELIVLETQPNCRQIKVNIFRSTITLVCSIEFYGNIYPRFDWSHGRNYTISRSEYKYQRFVRSVTEIHRNATISLEDEYWEVTKCKTYFFMYNNITNQVPYSNTRLKVDTLQNYLNLTCSINTTWPAVSKNDSSYRVVFGDSRTNISIYTFNLTKDLAIAAKNIKRHERTLYNEYILDKEYNEAYGFFFNNHSTILANWNTSLKDAGQYEWPETKYSAQIIVFDSNPACNNSLSSDKKELSCRCIFTGSWSPTIQWAHAASLMSSKIINNTLTSVLTVQRNLSILEQYDEIYQCKTFFMLDNKPNGTDTHNISDYTYICDVIVSWSGPIKHRNCIQNSDQTISSLKFNPGSTSGVSLSTDITSLSDVTSAPTSGFWSRGTLLPCILGSIATVSAVVIIVLVVLFRRRLAKEQHKVLSLEDAVRTEKLRWRPLSGTKKRPRSSISIIAPVVRTTNSLRANCNSTYAEISEPDLSPEIKPYRGVIESTYAELNLPDQPDLNQICHEPHSKINHICTSNDQGYQDPCDMLPLATYSQDQSYQDPGDILPLAIYSKVNKNGFKDVSQHQDQVKILPQVTYSEVNKKQFAGDPELHRTIDNLPMVTYSEVKKKKVPTATLR